MDETRWEEQDIGTGGGKREIDARPGMEWAEEVYHVKLECGRNNGLIASLCVKFTVGDGYEQYDRLDWLCVRTRCPFSFL